MASRAGLFISYSHKDKRWLDKLLTHLKPLQRQGLIDGWSDQRIQAGERWRDEITKALDGAAAAILLVSPNFYASDFIVEQELPPLLQTADAGHTTILVLVIDHCRYGRD